jgi:hypothetical protein
LVLSSFLENDKLFLLFCYANGCLTKLGIV